MEWSQIADLLSWAFIIGGSFFALTGSFGIIRLPDVFARMHGAGMVDTLGIGMILLGLMFQAPNGMTVIKLALILIFTFFTSPTTCYALARAAISSGVKPQTITDKPSATQQADNKSEKKPKKNKAKIKSSKEDASSKT